MAYGARFLADVDGESKLKGDYTLNKIHKGGVIDGQVEATDSIGGISLVDEKFAFLRDIQFVFGIESPCMAASSPKQSHFSH